MALTLRTDARYDMPASFGPSIVPPRTEVRDAEALVLSVPTDRDATLALVPRHFDVPERPLLTVAHMSYRDVDYLGGRSYNEVVVTVGASSGGPTGDRIDAALALALWVDQPGALIAGREFMGLPKLLGRISALQLDPDGEVCFDCDEDGARLVEGSAIDLVAFPRERVERLNVSAGEVRTFGWRYIAAPGPGGGAALDQPMLNVMRWTYREAWGGRGRFAFGNPSRTDAPLSAAAVTALAGLPLLGDVRAFRGLGSAVIDRTATRSLI